MKRQLEEFGKDIEICDEELAKRETELLDELKETIEEKIEVKSK